MVYAVLFVLCKRLTPMSLCFTPISQSTCQRSLLLEVWILLRFQMVTHPFPSLKKGEHIITILGGG